MNNLPDLLQIALQMGFVGCLLLAVALTLAWRWIRSAFLLASLIMRYTLPVNSIKALPRYGMTVAALALLLWAFSAQLFDFSELLEYRYFQPVYLSDKIDDGKAVEMYEQTIREKCPGEAETVIRWTGETASKINSTKQAIYESALLECGLNPFRVRDDRVAAGWIQFTRAGLSGLGVALHEVISACERRDAEFIMSLTDRYLIRKWEQAGKPDMRNTIDLYLSIFAPAHIGGDPEKVVYAGFGNMAYSLNSGLDGWYQDGERIARKTALVDGRITVWEIYLCLERKKRLLLKN
jgi:hypothetical protein